MFNRPLTGINGVYVLAVLHPLPWRGLGRSLSCNRLQAVLHSEHLIA